MLTIALQIELESLKNETDIFSRERKARVEATLENRKQKAAELTSLWQSGSLSSPDPRLHEQKLTFRAFLP